MLLLFLLGASIGLHSVCLNRPNLFTLNLLLIDITCTLFQEKSFLTWPFLVFHTSILVFYPSDSDAWCNGAVDGFFIIRV